MGCGDWRLKETSRLRMMSEARRSVARIDPRLALSRGLRSTALHHGRALALEVVEIRTAVVRAKELLLNFDRVAQGRPRGQIVEFLQLAHDALMGAQDLRGDHG